MFLDSEFITDKHTQKEEKEFRAVLSLMAATPDCIHNEDDMVTDWSKLKTALLTKSFGLDGKSALLLEEKLAGWRSTALPWEIEMEIHMGESDELG